MGAQRQSHVPSHGPGHGGSASLRAVWVAITLVVAAIAGLLTGLLAWLGGANIANAILSGGAAFGVTTLLILAVIEFLDRGSA
ncbi:hypothetical protein [Dactylosporangium sp. NPDC050588]|uniref:hypothetical protein n=1 Tax=Dactylosporangium sp. NPDC050588 TaxID=3157211 RepID=UPI0033E8A071